MRELARRRPEIALGAILTFAAVVLWDKARDQTFVRDDWSMILYRDLSLDGLLSPHNDQVAVLPAIFWRGLVEIVGIDSYAPYLAAHIAANLLCGVLLYVYVARRLGPPAGLAAAAVLVLLGPAWEAILWPFEISFIGSVAFGIGALLALDRGDRRGDWAAAVLILLSIASSNAGLPFAAAAAAQVVATRADLPGRLLRVLALPLTLYAAWYLVYRDDIEAAHAAQPPQPRFIHLVEETPRFAFDLFSFGLGAVSGLPSSARTALGTVALIAILVRLLRPLPLPPAGWAALALALAHFGGIAFTRYNIQAPDTSRYAYLSAAAILLLAAALLPRPAPSRRIGAVILTVAAAVVLANLTDLRRAGSLHEDSTRVRAALAAVELAGDRADPSFAPVPGAAAPDIRAGAYLEAVRDHGSPAYSLAELERVPDDLRQMTDAVLVDALGFGFEPVAAEPERAGPPPLTVVSNARVTRRGECAEVAPTAGAGSVDSEARELVVEAGAGQVELRVRRFADNHLRESMDALPPGERGALTVPADDVDRPWHLLLTSDSPFTVC